MFPDGHWRASSVYRNNHSQFGVHLAEDGKLSLTSSTGLFRSKRELYPWMQIKLPFTVGLTSVTVVNRLDGAVVRMLEVRAGLDEVPFGVDAKILDVNEVCGHISGGGVHDVIQCDKPILAQYLTVQMLQKGSLVINEIRVNSGRLLIYLLLV